MTTRHERIKIAFEFDKEKVEHFDKDLRILFNGPYTSFEVLEGDVLKLDYTFDIKYLENMSEKLRIVQTFCRDKGLIKGLDVKELFCGECLVEEVLKELRTLKSLLEAKC